MWKMFDDMIECDECAGIMEAPPKFMIPPPPRPPAMGDYNPNCNEEEMAQKAQKAWDNDMCEAMPILDASLYSSQSLQTSAMIAVFSLLLVLVVLISSLFVWKNKRKVQNFLPCKTPTRGPHMNGGLPLGGAHSVTYEDPDAHLGHHRPLVMRHHHNVEHLLHGKSIHYPSGYPMTRSPPFLVSSSPGPDPYRSNDNVYEELGPGRDSDGESEPPMHSDDDFAEDELSLPGERSFNKAGVMEANSCLAGVNTIYHERSTAGAAAAAAAAAGVGVERNSVMSSSSSTNQDASTATAASSSSSHNNNSNNNNNNATMAAAGSASALLSGMLRHTTGRSKINGLSGARSRTVAAKNANSVDDFNTSTSTADTVDIAPLQQLYDNRSNLMSLGYAQQQHQQQQHAAATPAAYHHSLHHLHHNNNIRSTAPQFYNTMENEVERRNRINAQLSHTPVSTIFRERIHYPGSGRYPQPYYASNSSNGLLANSMRARTNPRDRRHRITAPTESLEPAYGYAEPVYHHNYHYDSCNMPAANQRLMGEQQQRLAYPAYIMPDYTSSNGLYRGQPHSGSSAASSSSYQHPSHLYGRGGDSSFGSDSGYSHHTPASSIGRHDYDVAVPMPACSNNSNYTPKTPSKLSAALSFGWNRRKSTPSTPTSLNVLPNATTAATNANTINCNTEATSPNNNTANSTIVSSLEHSCNASNNTVGPNNNTLLTAAAAASQSMA